MAYVEETSKVPCEVSPVRIDPTATLAEGAKIRIMGEELG